MSDSPSALLAFVHHLAAFTLVAALTVQFALFDSKLDHQQIMARGSRHD
jgi:uncharacterized membrane protein